MYSKSLLFFILSLIAVLQSIANVDSLEAHANKILYSNPDSARIIYRQILKSGNYNRNTSTIERNIGISYDIQSNFDSALFHFERALKLAGNNDSLAAKALNSLGVVYFNLSDYTKSYEYYNQTLHEAEMLKDTLLIAKTLGNIGHIFFYQNDLEKSVDYYTKALEYGNKINNEDITSNQFQNLGNVYYTQKNLEKALEYYEKSLKLDEASNHLYRAAYTLTGLAMISREMNKTDDALSYFRHALTVRKKMGDKVGECNVYINMAELYTNVSDMKSAIESSKMALHIADSIQNLEAITHALERLAKSLSNNGQYKEAIDYYHRYLPVRDSIYNIENKEKLLELEKKYEGDKKSMKIDILEKEALVYDIEVSAKNQQLLFMGIGLSALVILTIVSFKAYYDRKSVLNKLEEQNREIESKNKHITDSIKYARRIQNAILPPLSRFESHLEKSFVIYIPKDVIAGDFYWLEAQKDRVLFAVADCTGHGVPGAMVSVVCNNGLNRSVREFGLTKPGEILNKAREIVLKEFGKPEYNVNDGMDIGICSLKGNKLRYAGANISLFLIRNGTGEVSIIKSDKQPIGIFDNPKPYTTHELDLEEGDSIYIFSDGMQDQFGGPKGKKFMISRLKKLLIQIQKEPLSKQQELIQSAFEEWRGDEEQLDDICAIGVRL